MTAHCHLDEDRVLDLVNGLLPADERRATLVRAAACPDCESLLRSTAATHERARSRAVQQLSLVERPATLRSRDGAVEDDEATPVPTPEITIFRLPRSRWQSWSRPAFGIAALLTLVSAGTFMWRGQVGNRGTALGQIDWLPSPNPVVVTRDSLPAMADQALADGLVAYRAHDAATTVRRLQDTHAGGALEQVRLLYLGNALLQLHRAPEAVAALQSLHPSMVPEPWRGEALWSLSLAWRATGETSRADSLLHTLSLQPGDIGERARRAWAASSR